jgi:hypothetical protein
VLQVRADVIPPVECAPVYIRRIALSARGQRFHQCDRLIAEIPESPGGVAEAQARQPKQRVSRRRARAYLQAASLDELPVIVVQCDADKGVGGRALLCAITNPQLQGLQDNRVRQPHDGYCGRPVMRASAEDTVAGRVSVTGTP